MDTDLDVAARMAFPITKGVSRARRSWDGRQGPVRTGDGPVQRYAPHAANLGNRVPGNVEELNAAGPAHEPGQAARGRLRPRYMYPRVRATIAPA